MILQEFLKVVFTEMTFNRPIIIEITYSEIGEYLIVTELFKIS